MKPVRNLVIFGTGDLAQIAAEYCSERVKSIAFTVDKERMVSDTFCGHMVFPFDRIKEFCPPPEWRFHAAVVYGDMNRLRAQKCLAAKEVGYTLASFMGNAVFKAASASLGDHHFIFEHNVIQSFVTIGDNCILWSGNHIGHHSTIGNNVFISSHVVISGHCNIGDNCFIGVNATISNGVHIGKECWISPGVIVTKDVPDHSFVTSEGVFPLNEAALFRALRKTRR